MHRFAASSSPGGTSTRILRSPALPSKGFHRPAINVRGSESASRGRSSASKLKRNNQFAACSVSARPSGVMSVNVADISSELERVIEVATSAAKEGGAVVRAKTGSDVIKTKGNPRDLLTEVDSEVQAIIEGAVESAFPSHGFLGEESVPPGPEASAAALENILSDPASPDWLWVVDPIDGTTNFVHGMPLSAISIGVAYKGEIVAGVILDPYRDECFTATLGGGAFCNGELMKVGKETSAGDATVCSGYGASGSSGPLLRGMEAMINLPVRTFRMIGSAAIMFAWVACGRLTAYFEADLNCWDIAAGALLVKEAGGQMSDINGDAYTLATRCVIGSNGATHEELRSALEKAGVLGLDEGTI